MQFGSLHEQAAELRVPRWIDGRGNPLGSPLTLADLGGGYNILFCFQHGCPACHARGFPTLKVLYEELAGRPFGFAAIQTVFEDQRSNTFDRLRANQAWYGLEIPFGHDVPLGRERYPTFVEDYRSAGTPWFTVIDPQGTVVYADFRLDPVRFLASLERESVTLERA